MNKGRLSLVLSILAILISLASCYFAFKNISLQQEEFSSERTLLLTAKFNKNLDLKGSITYSKDEQKQTSKIKLQSSSKNVKIQSLEFFYPSKILENGYDFSKHSSFVLLNTDIWVSIEPIVTLIKKFHSEIDPIKQSHGVDTEIMVLIKTTYVVKNHQYEQVSFYKIKYVFFQFNDSENNEFFSPVIFYGFEWITNIDSNDFDKILKSMKDDKNLTFKYRSQNWHKKPKRSLVEE